jgi:hypothetical protein
MPAEPAQPASPEPSAPEEPTHAPPLPAEATQQLPPDTHPHAEPAVVVPAGVPAEAAVLVAPPPSGPPPPGAAAGGSEPPPRYPVTLEFSGVDRLSRLSTIFRLILMLPLLIFVAILGGSFTSFSFLVGVGGGLISFVLVAHWITVLVRGRPVGWAWGTIVAMQRFILRSYSYFFLLTDRYPPFEGDWFLQYEVEKPVRIRRRQLFFWKTITSIPHFLVLSALWFGVAICEVFGWFAIIFTGRFPRGMQNFVVGWMRWYARVSAYWMSLRDEFPPYSLSATAGPGSRRSLLISAAIGLGVLVGIIGIIVAIVLSAVGSVNADVNYRNLTQGTQSPTIDVSNVNVTLLSAKDDYQFPGDLYVPDPGDRFVSFTVNLRNEKLTDLDVDDADFHLDGEQPVLASMQGSPPPRLLLRGQTGQVLLVFKIAEGARPKELTYRPSPGLKRAKFVFH